MDVKTVEKGCIRAYGKLTLIIMAMYGVIIGGIWLFSKWRDHTETAESTED